MERTPARHSGIAPVAGKRSRAASVVPRVEDPAAPPAHVRSRSRVEGQCALKTTQQEPAESSSTMESATCPATRRDRRRDRPAGGDCLSAAADTPAGILERETAQDNAVASERRRVKAITRRSGARFARTGCRRAAAWCGSNPRSTAPGAVRRRPQPARARRSRRALPDRRQRPARARFGLRFRAAGRLRAWQEVRTWRTQ